MKKRLLALLLVMAMTAALFAGCNNNTPGGTGGDNSEEPVEIVCQLLFLSEFNEGFYEIEAELNKMLERDLGIKVRFERTDLLTATSDATLMLSGDEQLDICISVASVSQYIDSGLIIPMDDLYEQYGQDIVQGMGPMLDLCRANGQLYGVTVMGANASGYGYNMKKSFADKYNLNPDPNKVYTVEEMEAIFETIDAGEPDGTLMYVPWFNTFAPLNNNLCNWDPLNGNLSWGALMIDNPNYDPTKIVNLFATEEYADFCQTMYEWVQKGWISADAAVSTEGPDTICLRENVVGTFAYGAPEGLKQSVNWADEVVVFNMVPPTTMGGQAGIMWHITSSCEHPDKAMQLLNYLYANPDAFNLMQYGREGTEYEIVEQNDTHKLARWLSANPAELPYFNAYPVWGNQLTSLIFEPNDINTPKIQQEVMDSIPESRVSPAVGYVFDPTNVSAELAAVSAVMAQYVPSLNSGAVDPSVTLPEFLEALKTAGIDAVIAENQRQLDAYIASKGE